MNLSMKNNLIKSLSFITIFVLSLGVFGQTLDHESWKLSKKEEMRSVKASDVQNYPYHYLKLKVNEQIKWNNSTNRINKYIATHAIVHINSQEGIDEFKSMYQSGSQEFFQYKVYKANGEVLDKSDDKEDGDGESVYNFTFSSIADLSNFDFSRFMIGNNKISGLDTNCQVEFILVTKKSYWGEEGDKYGVEFIQKDVPIYNYEFNLISPDYLEFRTDGFNGCPDPQTDESDDKNYISYYIDSIKPLHRSAITSYSGNRMGFLFVWYKNTSSSKTQIIYEYSNSARFFYENYMMADAAREKTVSKYLKTKPEFNQKQGLARLELLDQSIKEDFRSSYRAIALSEGIKEKRLSARSRLQLYTTILNSWNEKYELVFPNSRRYTPFSDKYDNPIFTDNIIIYVPKYDAYIYPSSDYNPVNLIPSSYTQNKAIFIKKKGVQGFSSGAYYIDSILPMDYTLNSNYSSYKLDVLTNTVQAEHSMKGWEGLPFWSRLKNINHQSIEDLVTGMAKLKYSDAVISQFKLTEVDKLKSPLNNPVEMSYSFSSKSLSEKNSNGYTINIGNLINDATGLQIKPKDQLSPDIYSGYERIQEIEIKIPEGYKVSDLSKIKVSKSHNSGSIEDAMKFSVEPEVKGNILKIKVTEIFKLGKYLPSDLDHFLDIYNSSWNLKDLNINLTKK